MNLVSLFLAFQMIFNKIFSTNNQIVINNQHHHLRRRHKFLVRHELLEHLQNFQSNLTQLRNWIKKNGILRRDASYRNLYSYPHTKKRFDVEGGLDMWEPINNEIFRKSKSLKSTRFYLYSRKNPRLAQELCINDLDSLKKSNFDPNKRTVFLINGWQDNRFFAKWVREGVGLLLKRADQNVIYVGWQSINELFVAAIIIRRYSKCLALFIRFLKKVYQISGDSIHCIGHSLGGFICAFAGDNTYIGRVTVLDAGPRPYYQNKPLRQRINRYQAGFMDVIHSDFHPIFSLGLTIPFGDVDFFPNAGTVQTGCWRDKWYQGLQEFRRGEGALVASFQVLRYVLFCSHYRSHEWFFESLRVSRCQFVGVLCPTYQMYVDGECGCEDMWIDGHGESTCAVMGYDSEYAVLQQGLTKFSPMGRWFIRTSDFYIKTGVHCQYQYQLIAKLDPSIFSTLGKFSTHHNVSLKVALMSSDQNESFRILIVEKLYPKFDFNQDVRLTKLILQPDSLPLSKISAVMISLDLSSGVDFQKKWFSVRVPWIKLSPIRVVQNEPIFFCHLDHQLRPGISKLLRRCLH